MHQSGRVSSRRDFLASVATAALGAAAGCAHRPESPADVLDTHTHFYNPRRPEGVPWPPKNDTMLYRPVFPSEFLRLASPLGIRETVVVEASPWLEDNRWVLDLAKENPCIRGVVGNIKPGTDEFAAHLKRFAKHPLFRGIRIGVWEASVLTDATVLRDLRRLADHNLALDVLIGPDKLPDVALLAGTIPSLRMIVDHCANVRVDGHPPPKSWLAGLGACAPYPNLFMKVSGLVEGTGRSNGRAPVDGAFYQPTLDAVWNAFGEDRVIYGSNWPVSARFASYEDVFRIVERYAQSRGASAAQKYFSANGRRAYGLSPA